MPAPGRGRTTTGSYPQVHGKGLKLILVSFLVRLVGTLRKPFARREHTKGRLLTWFVQIWGDPNFEGPIGEEAT